MADTYNVFISWSGERSKKVAGALREWLPMVVQTAEPWMSEEDIEKGSRGLDDIGKALAAMGVGIICLTPENLEKPWILFEAGALSKALGDKTRVCPFLFGDLRPENVKPPLGMFQATKAVKDDTRKLVATVNRVLGGSLGEEKLDTVFERMWPELEKRLGGVPKAQAAAAPQRSDREMLAEMLELVRAGAINDAEAGEILGRLQVRVAMILDRIGRGIPQSALSGAGARTLAEMNPFWNTFTDSALSEPNEGSARPLSTKEMMKAAQRSLAELNAAQEETERRIAMGRTRIMRLNRNLQKEKAGQEGSDTAKKADEDKK